MILKLFRIFIKVVTDNPFQSMLIFIGITFVGTIQIVTIGSIYPIIQSVIGQSDQVGNTVIGYYNYLLGIVGLKSGLRNYLLLFITATTLSGIIFLISEAQQAYFLRRLEFAQRFSLVKKVVGSQWEVLRNMSHGDLINTLTREVELNKVVIKYTFIIASQITQTFFYLIAAYAIAPKIVILGVLLAGVGSFIFYPMMKKGSAFGHAWTDAFSNLSESLIGTARAFKNIKSGSAEKYVLKYLKNPLFNVSQIYCKKQILAVGQTKLSELVGYIILSFLVFYGIVILKLDSAIFLLALIMLNKTMLLVRQIIDGFHRACSSLPSIIKIENTFKQCEKQTRTSGIPITKELRDIKLESVSFEYNSEKRIYDDFSFLFQKGGFYAVTGSTGGGKTTLLDLMVGILEPNTGNIFYNNIAQKDVQIESLHQRIGYLTQEHFIFAGSILENIYWGIENPNHSKLEKSLKISQLEELIQEKSLEFKISESGQNLSGGQKQRIAIARTILKDYDFILMDEPTSALDRETEQKFIKLLAELKGEIGIILVTHRQEYLKYADHILTIEEGKVREKDSAVPLNS